MKRRMWVAMAFALALVASYALASLGQQMPDSNRKPPCGCFICPPPDKPPNWIATVNFGLPDCAGTLARDACAEELAKMPSEQRAPLCQKIKAEGGYTSFKDCPVFASVCEPEKEKKPDCEPPRAGSNNPPWLGGDCRSDEEGRVIMTVSGTSQNRSLRGQSMDSLQDCRVELSLFCEARGYTRITGFTSLGKTASECDAFVSLHKRFSGVKVCCDKYREAVASERPCRADVDADCDGLPNDEDSFPFYSPPREFQNASDKSGMLPPFKDLADHIPQEPCEGCQWTVSKLDYKCKNVEMHARESYREAQYEYEATWKCPSTGRELVTNGRVSARGAQCPRQ